MSNLSMENRVRVALERKAQTIESADNISMPDGRISYLYDTRPGIAPGEKRRRTGLIAAAAVVLVILALGYVLTRGGSSSTQVQIVDEPTTAPSTDTSLPGGDDGSGFLRQGDPSAPSAPAPILPADQAGVYIAGWNAMRACLAAEGFPDAASPIDPNFGDGVASIPALHGSTPEQEAAIRRCPLTLEGYDVAVFDQAFAEANAAWTARIEAAEREQERELGGGG